MCLLRGIWVIRPYTGLVFENASKSLKMAPSWYEQKIAEIESPAPARQFSLAAGVADDPMMEDSTTSSVSLADGCEDVTALREKLKRRAERTAKLRWRYRGIKLSRGAELRRRVDLESKLDTAKCLFHRACRELEDAKKMVNSIRHHFTRLPPCVVCLHRPRTVVFVPCDHLCCCSDCLSRQCDENGVIHCPICHVSAVICRDLNRP